MQTKTAHHDSWHPRFSAPQVALTRPRLWRFALHFTIVVPNLTLGPNKGVEEDRDRPSPYEGLVEAGLALPVAFMAIWLRNLPLYLAHEGMAKWPSGDA